MYEQQREKQEFVVKLIEQVVEMTTKELLPLAAELIVAKFGASMAGEDYVSIGRPSPEESLGQEFLEDGTVVSRGQTQQSFLSGLDLTPDDLHALRQSGIPIDSLTTFSVETR